ncbi:MAG: dihydrofolate reductase family protein [Tahibacter sp.]
MRQLIAAMKISLDGKIEGPDGYADWVEAWSDDYGLTSQIDACLLGGRMYPGYEHYWSAIQDCPTDQALPLTGKPPSPAEIQWARFAANTPHYVLSSTVTSARWARTRFITTFEEVSALKAQSGKDIYLMGGAQLTASLIDAGLVDELRLIVYPLLAGAGKSLFAVMQQRRALELQKVQQMPKGLLALTYRVT